MRLRPRSCSESFPTHEPSRFSQCSDAPSVMGFWSSVWEAVSHLVVGVKQWTRQVSFLLMGERKVMSNIPECISQKWVQGNFKEKRETVMLWVSMVSGRVMGPLPYWISCLGHLLLFWGLQELLWFSPVGKIWLLCVLIPSGLSDRFLGL